MTNTIDTTCTEFSMTHHWQTSFGMPVARLRVAPLRRLAVTTGVVIAPAADTSALSQDVAVERAVMTDAAVKGAFPGTSAWSPPI